VTNMVGKIGLDGPEVSAVGLGCWAIGGPFLLGGRADGWGDVDDAESIRAIDRAVDLGVTLFDTADVYGIGHSERVLGQALGSRRAQVLIATKFGYTYDESSGNVTGVDVSPGYMRRACDASLRRLQTDYIDLYQLHVGDVPPETTDDVFAVLDELVDAGKIRGYGWSTPEPSAIRRLGDQRHAGAAQFELNVLAVADDALTACAETGLMTLANTPLAMGLLTGKFDAGSRLPNDDVRGSGHSWVTYFTAGRPDPDHLRRLAAVRETLTSDGRTLAQGALAWVMARGPRIVPIPGFKSVAQAVENAAAIDRGPLTQEQMADIDNLLSPV
jgi:aryl-alcohol dehydrogenase-like predicted oxidoreductase